MKNFNLSIFAIVLISSFVFFSGCKEDEPEPVNNNNTVTKTPGTIEGTLTFQGTTYIVNGIATSASYIYVSARYNNDYPAVTVYFNQVPTKDSTYTISSNNYVRMASGSNSTFDDYYAFSGGTVQVTKQSSGFTAVFSNVTATNSNNSTTPSVTGSATLRVY
jgi:hypothetical protein